MTARYFESPEDFRRWLASHHATEAELLVGFHKRGSGRPSMTWPESVEQALCFGWIDGVRRRVDEERYTIRFTPRRASSRWSLVNVRKARELIAAGLMEPAGRAAFERRTAEQTGPYSFEQAELSLGEEYERALAADEAAWTFFQAQPPWYRKVATWYVISAKREGTRRRRLDILIERCSAGERIGPARPARADPGQRKRPRGSA